MDWLVDHVGDLYLMILAVIVVFMVAMFAFAVAARAELQPDPPPEAHHPAHVTWTYTVLFHTKKGLVRCVYRPHHHPVCRRVKR